MGGRLSRGPGLLQVATHKVSLGAAVRVGVGDWVERFEAQGEGVGGVEGCGGQRVGAFLRVLTPPRACPPCHLAPQGRDPAANRPPGPHPPLAVGGYTQRAAGGGEATLAGEA